MIRKNLIDSTDFGIYIDHCQSIIIDDNNFTNGETAMTIYSSNNNTIIDNNIINNDVGLTLRDSSFNTITGNNISNNINSMYVDMSNNVVLGNSISNNLRGIYLLDSSYSNIVSDNNISSNDEYGIRPGGSYNIISKNTISHNDDGIFFDDVKSSSNNYTITGNTISNNNGDGIELTNVSFYTITGNNISNNDNGIILCGSRSTTISGNTITSNINNGIVLYAFMWKYAGETDWHHFPFKNNQIIGNLISDNGENGIILWADFKYCFKSRNNIILENNMINNKQDAFIMNAFLNRWYRNYWNDGRLLPKLIFGVIQRDYDTIGIPWFNIDWLPAKGPYDI
jgi:parallel beta-helix repeat protein